MKRAPSRVQAALVAALAVLLGPMFSGCSSSERPDDPAEPGASGGSRTGAATPIEPEEAVARGLAAAREHDWAGAIECFQVARLKAPYDPAVLLNLGLAYARDGQEVHAISFLEAYLAAVPESAKAEAIHQEIFRLEQSIEASIGAILDQAAEAAGRLEPFVDEPTRYGVLRSIASTRAYSGDLAGAVETFSLVPEKANYDVRRRSNAVCRMWRVYGHLDCLALDAASSEFAKVDKADAELLQDEATIRRTYVLRNIYDWEHRDLIWLDRAWLACQAMAIRSQQFRSKHMGASLACDILDLRLRDGGPAAIPAVEELVGGIPESEAEYGQMVREKMAGVLVKRLLEWDDPEAAWRVYEGPWFSKKPGGPVDLFGIAVAFLAAGDSTHARAVARDALQGYPEGAIGKSILGDDAALLDLLTRDKTNSCREAWIQILISRGEILKARSVADSASDSREYLRMICDDRASVYLARQGKLDEALAARRYAGSSGTFRILATACVRAGRLPEAERMIAPESYSLLARLLAEICRDSGRTADALRLLAAASGRTFDRELLLLIARDQKALGDMKAAGITLTRTPDQATWVWSCMDRYWTGAVTNSRKATEIARESPKNIPGSLCAWAGELATCLSRIRRTRVILAQSAPTDAVESISPEGPKAAAARIEALRSELAEAQRELERVGELRGAGTASEEQFETAQDRVARLKIRLELAEMRRERAEAAERPGGTETPRK